MHPSADHIAAESILAKVWYLNILVPRKINTQIIVIRAFIWLKLARFVINNVCTVRILNRDLSDNQNLSLRRRHQKQQSFGQSTLFIVWVVLMLYL